MSLLGDLFFKVPLTITVEIFNKLLEEVEKEALMTEDSIKRKLQEYQLLLEDGKMTEEQYEKLETKLMERLRKIREGNK